MDSAQKLTPVALKATGKVSALALLLEGYVQADQNILCPLCGMKFLLLLDPRDRCDHFHHGDDIRQVMVAFQQKVAGDHAMEHGNERFGFP